jgi:uncharacterized protein YecT (DUF1311 family)
MAIRQIPMLLLLLLTACGGVKTDSAVNTTIGGTTLERQNSTAVRNAMCPDDKKVDLEDCKFTAALAPLTQKGTAVARFKSALCGEYDQTTINFCVGKLSALAEEELDGAEYRARKNPALKKVLENQSRWLQNSRKSCVDKYDGNQDGTGYVSFITFCKITLTARRIDELSGSLSKVNN